MIPLNSDEISELKRELSEGKFESPLWIASYHLLNATANSAGGFHDMATGNERKAALVLEPLRRSRQQCTCALKSFFGGAMNCPQHGKVL